MGVFKRADSVFFQLYLEPDPARGLLGKKVTTKIRSDAKAKWQRNENLRLATQLYHERMIARARGAAGPKPAIAFSAFAAWFREHKLPHRRGRERDGGILARLLPVFGAYSLAGITPAVVVERWITPRLTSPTVIKKARGTAARTVQAGPSTVNREVDLLKAVLQAGVPEYLERSPLFGMKRLKTTTPKRRLLQPDEEERLLRVMAPDDKAFFLIGLDALVRLTDILDVKWTDDHGDQLWIADPKAGGGFKVPLSRRARRALDKVPKNSSLYIFSRRRAAETERDRRNGISRMLRKYCEAANVPYGRAKGGITFHWATRRTGATRMLTRNVDVGTVQKVGRWKTPSVVLGIYHELIDEEARAAVETVGPRRRKRGRDTGIGSSKRLHEGP